jgi:hypothetical protein
MGIINGLLTGGILIGKICQALSPSKASNKFVHKKSNTVLYGAVESGGITFYRKEVDGQSTIYAANTSTSSQASIVVPNGDSSGLTYVLEPLSSLPFAEAESSTISPTTNVVTGLVDEGSTSYGSMANGKGSLLKMAFEGLKAGKSIYIGSFKLSCNTTQLLILSTTLTVLAISYFYFNSNKGVSATSQNIIPPNAQASADSEGEVSFGIDFKSLGIDPSQDSFDGQVTFEVESSSSGNGLSSLSKIASTPFDEAEREFFSSKIKA